jgi:CRISPR-associated exonuclease Cas4
MLKVSISKGAFFYGDPRRRLEVLFTIELRSRTESLAATMHQLFRAGVTPAAQPGLHCRNCSLVDLCLPVSTDGTANTRKWLDRQIRGLSASETVSNDRF